MPKNPTAMIGAIEFNAGKATLTRQMSEGSHASD